MPGLGKRARIDGPAKRRPRDPVTRNGRHHFDGAHRPASEVLPPRFPIARQGYDRAIVDQRFAELEQEVIELDRELANLQASQPLRTEAAPETFEIGKQVSAILIAAHESAGETRRLAEAEAGGRIADAESRARSITEDANAELKRLRDEMASLRSERNQLIDEIRCIAYRLGALADKPSEDAPVKS